MKNTSEISTSKLPGTLNDAGGMATVREVG